YELPDETMAWELSAETARAFRQTDRASRMALRVHPRGPQLQTAGTLFSELYGLTPAPLFQGVGVDFGV
ncbi:MAG TPA: hypothetical protein VFG86_02970, partial [Chloroflexota bacterium]|nr:hypothetical protein [Chloroflexota bacterium]